MLQINNERSFFRHWHLLVVPLTLSIAFSAQASAVKVGNGDGGDDLEGAVEVHEGPFIDSRTKAVELLEKLNVQGVTGLSLLLPEVAQSQVYVAQRDVNSDFEVISSYEVNRSGLIYAKTFPEPHAPTRFFPVAKTLSEDDLVALHIHEGLHRALPKSIREDEKVVARITLALVTPGASKDRVTKVVQQNLNSEALAELDLISPPTGEVQGSQLRDWAQYPNLSKNMRKPTTLGYEAISFVQKESYSSDKQLRLVHSITSHLYPFGSGPSALGLGVRLSLMDRQGEYTLGPVDISARMKLWTLRGFDVDGYGAIALNPLSAEEMASRVPGRDSLTLGVTLHKSTNSFYVENFLGFTAPGGAQQLVGNINYQHEFGSIYSVRVRSGVRWKDFLLGGLAEVNLSDGYRVSGGAFVLDDDLSRFRIVSVGPEVVWDADDYQFGVFGKAIIDATEGVDYDYLGNLMNVGMGRGRIGIYFNVRL